MLTSTLLPSVRLATRAFSTSRVSARDVAKMTLIGRLGVIEERENAKTGKPYLMYKIATTDKGRAPVEGEEYKQPPTSWHTIFAHGAAIERLQMIEKGSLVFAEASFSVASNKDEATGVYTNTISATHERLTVLKRPQRSTEESAESTSEQQ
ncbi:Rim1p [Sporobolomyces salmoneus]|uniref:Rim1p n=1 Tax=Sporobolomyces salmoneus TaxID=183962 RepID=UPI003179F650